MDSSNSFRTYGLHFLRGPKALIEKEHKGKVGGWEKRFKNPRAGQALSNACQSNL